MISIAYPPRGRWSGQIRCAGGAIHDFSLPARREHCPAHQASRTGFCCASGASQASCGTAVALVRAASLPCGRYVYPDATRRAVGVESQPKGRWQLHRAFRPDGDDRGQGGSCGTVHEQSQIDTLALARPHRRRRHCAHVAPAGRGGAAVLVVDSAARRPPHPRPGVRGAGGPSRRRARRICHHGIRRGSGPSQPAGRRAALPPLRPRTPPGALAGGVGDGGGHLRGQPRGARQQPRRPAGSTARSATAKPTCCPATTIASRMPCA